MTLMTAYNQDIQRYIEKPSTNRTKTIIQEIKERALAEGLNFNRLFPANTKRYKVLDTVVYMASVGGICKIQSGKLAEKVGAKVRTVKDAVKNIKQLGCFLVGGMADGHNKYVFVYKHHPNYREILANVFFVTENEVISHPTAQQIAQRESAESIDMSVAERQKSSPIPNYLSISKQEKEYIQESIEKELQESQNQEHLEQKRVQEYCTNPYQRMLYDFLKANFTNTRIRENAAIIALRAGSNMDVKAYQVACKVMDAIDFKLHIRTAMDSIPAVFQKMYTDRLKYGLTKTRIHEPKQNRDTSYLYNWVDE